MLLRVLFSLVNIAIFLVLFALYFVIPQYADYLFYLLLAWFVASFLLLRLPVMSRRVGGGSPSPSASSAPAANYSSGALAGTGAPLPSVGASTTPGVDATEIGFCPHCGTNVSPGTLVCPSCGRSTRLG